MSGPGSTSGGRAVLSSSERLRDSDDVRAWLAANVFAPRPDDPVVGRVGLEVELFPFWMTPEGRPAGRFALVELACLLEGIPGVARRPRDADGRPSWSLDGVLLTEEPGAQLEVCGPPDPDGASAVARVEAVIERLAAAFTTAGAGIAATGLDCWSERERLPVQVEIPRYEAMTAYFERRGDRRQGHLLMCSTCSLQVNVDLGPPRAAQQRWLLANLAAPVLTAAFATSPTKRWVNGRAAGWRGLDPTRTGVAPPLAAGSTDPLEHALSDALRADVMLVERDGQTFAGGPGWDFGSWVARGHPVFGQPTVDDLRRHLTTLFPEARLRGYLEVRSLDELPRRWRGAAVALLCGLLYDERAGSEALAVLEPHVGVLPDLLDRAAHDGLGDPLLAELAGAVLGAGVEGAVRLGDPNAAAAAEYFEAFPARRRHPSDELRALLASGSVESFAWAAESAEGPSSATGGAGP